jgi:hypothetical protein
LLTRVPAWEGCSAVEDLRADAAGERTDKGRHSVGVLRENLKKEKK